MVERLVANQSAGVRFSLPAPSGATRKRLRRPLSCLRSEVAGKLCLPAPREVNRDSAFSAIFCFAERGVSMPTYPHREKVLAVWPGTSRKNGPEEPFLRFGRSCFDVHKPVNCVDKGHVRKGGVRKMISK